MPNRTGINAQVRFVASKRRSLVKLLALLCMIVFGACANTLERGCVRSTSRSTLANRRLPRLIEKMLSPNIAHNLGFSWYRILC